MITDERLTTFINSLESRDLPILEEIEQEALDANVPIIRKETQSFLKVLLQIHRPMRILEAGTAVGFFRAFDERLCPGGMSYYYN